MSTIAVEDFGDQVINEVTVKALLAGLPDELRRVLEMWQYEGRTFAEIGQLIGDEFRNGEPLTDSGARYLRDQALALLRQRVGPRT